MMDVSEMLNIDDAGIGNGLISWLLVMITHKLVSNQMHARLETMTRSISARSS